jgi:DNA polymerase-4
MLNAGIKTGADLKRIEKEKLVRLFGKAGNYFYNIARGIDNRPVESEWIRKSLGKETTLREDIDDVEQMIEILDQIALRLEDLLKRDSRKGKTITLKIKYHDFKSITRSITTPEPVTHAEIIMQHVRSLIANTEAGTKKVRLLGISISNFTDETGKTKKHLQLPLPI